MAAPDPRTITLTLRAWIVAAIIVVAGLGVFVAQLVLIAQQRNLITHLDQVSTHQARRARPVLHAADALLGSPQDARAALQRGSRALSSLQSILDEAGRQDLVQVAASSLRHVPALVADVEQAVAVLDRTYPTLRASLDVQRQTLGLQERTFALLERSLGVQQRTERHTVTGLRIAGQTRDIAAQTRDIGQATLGHAASLDRKTGGPILGSGR